MNRIENANTTFRLLDERGNVIAERRYDSRGRLVHNSSRPAAAKPTAPPRRKAAVVPPPRNNDIQHPLELPTMAALAGASAAHSVNASTAPRRTGNPDVDEPLSMPGI